MKIIEVGQYEDNDGGMCDQITHDAAASYGTHVDIDTARRLRKALVFTFNELNVFPPPGIIALLVETKELGQ